MKKFFRLKGRVYLCYIRQLFSHHMRSRNEHELVITRRHQICYWGVNHLHWIALLTQAIATGVFHKPHSQRMNWSKNRGSAFIGIRSRTQLTEGVRNAINWFGYCCFFCIGNNKSILDRGQSAKGCVVFMPVSIAVRSRVSAWSLILLAWGIPAKNAACHRGGLN